MTTDELKNLTDDYRRKKSQKILSDTSANPDCVNHPRYYEETEALIKIGTELYQRGDSLGLLDLIDTYNDKMSETMDLSLQGEVRRLCQEVRKRDVNEPGLKAAADVYEAKTFEIEVWDISQSKQYRALTKKLGESTSVMLKYPIWCYLLFPKNTVLHITMWRACKLWQEWITET